MAFLFFAVLLLIVYGSLYPFDFTMAGLASGTAGENFYSWNVFSSRGDVLGNVALFAPYGFVGMVTLPPGRPFLANFIPLALFGIVVAVTVQVLQLFLPARDAALSDVLWNSLGMTLGAAAAALRPVQDMLRRPAGIHAELVPILLIGSWFAAELAPFVPSIDLQLFKDNLKPLLLAPEFDWLKFCRGVVAWLIVGFLAGRSHVTRPAWLWLLGGMIAMLSAKVVIVQNAVTLSDVGAAATALPVWLFLDRLGERKARILLALLVTFMVVAALEPFDLRASGREFSWLPFAGSLNGSMLINAKVIAGKVFTIGSILYLAGSCGFHRRTAVTLAAAFLMILEVAQIWIGDHTPEITDPLLAVLLGLTFTTLGRHQIAVSARRAVPDSAGHSEPRQRSSADSSLAEALAPTRNPRVAGHPDPGAAVLAPGGMAMLAAGCAAIVIAMQVVIHLPGIPYNVRELFDGDNAWWKLAFFALAMLSIGMGGALAGRFAARSRHPYLALPGAAILACLVTYVLLALGTSTESIEDIVGSSNTYFFVTERHIWGDAGGRLYKAIGSVELIAAAERVVRFVALFGPVFCWLGVAGATYLKTRRETGAGRAAGWVPVLSALVYTLCVLPWLVLFKTIAFDHSSTDNLNELIQDRGHVLYGLLILLPAVATAVVHAARTLRARDVTAAVVVVAVSLPIGWALFSNGLASEVQKYGHVFSGVDFLLGPDREELLPELVLMLRWYAVQLAAVAMLAYGMRIVMPAAWRATGFAMA